MKEHVALVSLLQTVKINKSNIAKIQFMLTSVARVAVCLWVMPLNAQILIAASMGWKIFLHAVPLILVVIVSNALMQQEKKIA